MRASTFPSRNRSCPRLEPLEGRSLLSGLSASLTTDKSVYHVGEPIKLVYAETNTSDQPTQIAVGPSSDGFNVTEFGVPVWQSNAGINPLFAQLVTLQPGQSYTLSSTWDGVASPGDKSPQVPGIFTVTNQLAPDGPSTSFQIVDSTGVVVSPIKPAPLPIAVAVTTDRTSYKLAQRVSINLTLTNTTNQTIMLPAKPGSFGFRVYRGTSVVGQENRRPTIARSRPAATAQNQLAAGQSKAIGSTWVAGRNAHGAKALKPGSYTILAWDGGYSALTTIQVGR
jgi:hypothetical protein